MAKLSLITPSGSANPSPLLSPRDSELDLKHPELIIKPLSDYGSLSDRAGPSPTDIKNGDVAFDTAGLDDLYAPIESYEGRHRWDPKYEWDPKEEKRLVRKVRTIQQIGSSLEDAC